MFTNAQYVNKPSYKIFFDDLKLLHNELNQDLARIWYYLNEEFIEVSKNVGQKDV